jgi:RHS repeat-associated protein
MPMKARYTVVDGEVLAEKRSGSRKLYVPDPLGSTVALTDSTQAKTDTFSYWPYGEERTRTGSTATPFRFVGMQGYYRDTGLRSYVRARYLSTYLAQWITQPHTVVAPETGYSYCQARPSTATDRFAKATAAPPHPGIPPACVVRAKRYCDKAKANPSNGAWKCICDFANLVCGLIIRPLPGVNTRCLEKIGACLYRHYLSRDTPE